ncbi:MAG TPA: hypothetical protein VFE24_16060 [Pirellulales bacterium]|jgi:hypothetical protein|nr:hypothetical protein [Pirellulales bacterium]
MPALFDKLGIAFQYPENWALNVDDAMPGAIAVTVTSPSGAFWSATMHPQQADPQDLVDAVLAAMRQEYQSLEAEPIRETILGHEIVGYELNFFYVDLVGTGQVRAVSFPWTTFAIHCQAEDREFTQFQPVFDAMTLSLIQSSSV